MEHYITSGYLYHDEGDGQARYGIGIGAGMVSYTEEMIDGVLTKVKHVDKSKLFATFTSDRINFWQGDRIVAYFSNNEMYITESTVLKSMKLPEIGSQTTPRVMLSDGQVNNKWHKK